MAHEHTQERYTIGYKMAAEEMSQRTVSIEASFFAPHLRPGMQLLDCGCGPGTISLGLAAIVAPGEVEGIDLEESQLEAARAAAKQRGLTNVRFRVANIYALPFANAAFDAVLVHAVLEHLTQPLDALKEVQRVLKSGGIVGTRSPDQGGWIYTPTSSLLDKTSELAERLYQHNGGNRRIGRQLRGLLHQAGFVSIHATASYRSHGTPETVQWTAERFARLFTEPPMAEQILELGWATREELSHMATAWRAWAELPEAFLASAWGEAVGWKP
jgi:ubiquinone/menaquinone biosynthesis C-methylase UbiE